MNEIKDETHKANVGEGRVDGPEPAGRPTGRPGARSYTKFVSGNAVASREKSERPLRSFFLMFFVVLRPFFFRRRFAFSPRRRRRRIRFFFSPLGLFRRPDSPSRGDSLFVCRAAHTRCVRVRVFRTHTHTSRLRDYVPVTARFAAPPRPVLLIDYRTPSSEQYSDRRARKGLRGRAEFPTRGYAEREERKKNPRERLTRHSSLLSGALACSTLARNIYFI